jgi:hypothetical protein
MSSDDRSNALAIFQTLRMLTRRHCAQEHAQADQRVSCFGQGCPGSGSPSGTLFEIIDRGRQELKLLAREHNGFILWHKHLERQKIRWPHAALHFAAFN